MPTAHHYRHPRQNRVGAIPTEYPLRIRQTGMHTVSGAHKFHQFIKSPLVDRRKRRHGGVLISALLHPWPLHVLRSRGCPPPVHPLFHSTSTQPGQPPATSPYNGEISGPTTTLISVPRSDPRTLSTEALDFCRRRRHDTPDCNCAYKHLCITLLLVLFLLFPAFRYT